MEDPISSIKWINAGELKSNYWNPNRVHKQELKLLEHSLLSTGWIQPVLANKNGIIIDGFHRWRLTQDSAKVKARWGGLLPVATLDVEDDVAMAITVRINRAKGTHVAVEMNKLVHALLVQYGWTREEVAKEIGGTLQEVDLLAQDGVFAMKGIAKWAYSQAWYPAENNGKENQA